MKEKPECELMRRRLPSDSKGSSSRDCSSSMEYSVAAIVEARQDGFEVGRRDVRIFLVN